MAFPVPADLKHIPLTDDQRRGLTDFLSVELQHSEDERQGIIDRLEDEIKLYEAIPKEATKRIPWENASNLVVPIIGAMTDTIFPRIHSTVFNIEPVVTMQDKLAEFSDHAKALQDYFEIVQRQELQLSKVSVSWFLEAIVHGTSVVKVTWETIKTGIKEYDEAGEIVSRDEEVIKDGPALHHVPYADFYIPLVANSICSAQWVAHRFRTYWGRLKALEDTGVYKNLDNIKHRTEATSTDYVRTRQQIEDAEPSHRQDEYELFEVWLDFDYDNDGTDEHLLVTFHLQTQTILRAQFNPYWHRRKPFREFIYWPRHDRFGGIGIAGMVAPIQAEISTLHNQGIDNRTAGNTRMWEVVSGSEADRSFSGTAPGRKIKVNKLNEEIKPLEFASKADGFSDAEDIALRYAQQRTGVSDFLSGLDLGKGGGRETATTTMVRMQEARTRFNWTMDSAREAITDVSQMAVSLLQQFGDDRDIEGAVGAEKAELIRELLALSPDEIRDHVNITVTASSASMNKEAEKQNMIALKQMSDQHTLAFELPLAQIVLNPQAPEELREYAMEKLKGARKLFDRILQTFDAKNADEILGSLRALEAFEQVQQPAVPEPLAGPAGGVAAPPANVNVSLAQPAV